MKNYATLAIIAILLFSCNQGLKTSTKEDILKANLDTTVNPANDYFNYANGGWIKKNPIPNDLSSWSIGQLVNEENLNRLREINEKAAKENGAVGTTSQKIGDFWKTAMDSAKIESLGLKPLAAQFAEIDAITDIKSLLNTVADFKKIGSSTLFSDYIGQDDKKSDVMAYKLMQGGLGLPEREYYFKADSTTQNIRQKYEAHIAKILTMAGDNVTASTQAAKNILALETKLAKASRKMEDLRDPYKNYNKTAITDLTKLNNNIDWTSFLNKMQIKGIDSIIVGQPEFFKALDDVLKSTPIADFKSYLKFNLIRDLSNTLPEQYGLEAFNFNKLFSGAKERRPRWKRVIQTENGLMGELLGQLYVKEFFSEKTKQRYSDQVEAIRSAFKNRIEKLTWMSDSTKQKAYLKLAAMKKKVGYPDKWKDYSAMQIGTDSYTQNVMNARTWEYNHELNKLGKPVDREEWEMSPQTYNAYYNPSNNEIVLPAAQFIVPGYKDEELDDALVFGYAAASTIGHEITHGFDDEGRQYDAVGNLKNWWNKKDEEEFNKRTQVMIKQFDEYEPIKGYHINGKASLGENLADLGGILLGIDAFKNTEQYKKGEKISGLLPMERFYLGYALGWLGHQKEEQLRSRLLTDVHSPEKYRVNGPFADVDDFYNTYQVKQNNGMYRADSLRVRVW